jgi:hypothetical protein
MGGECSTHKREHKSTQSSSQKIWRYLTGCAAASFSQTLPCAVSVWLSKWASVSQSVSQFICLLGFRVCLCSIFSTTILIYLNQNNFIQNSEPNIHILVRICPLEQQELCDGKAAAGVPVSNCGRDLQKLPHPAGHMTQGSESLASPPPPAMIQYGLVWR